MDSSITVRSFQRTDISYFSEVINRVWGVELAEDLSKSFRFSKALLLYYLTQQNFAKVALYKGQPVGVILAQDEHEKKRKNTRYQLQFWTLQMASRFDKRQKKAIKKTDAIDQQLLDDSPGHYQAEIKLLIVNPEYQNLKIGRELLLYTMHHLAARWVDSVYLFTDSTCNYNFYDRMGMVQRSKITTTVDEGSQTNDYFLYDGCPKQLLAEDGATT